MDLSNSLALSKEAILPPSLSSPLQGRNSVFLLMEATRVRTTWSTENRTCHTATVGGQCVSSGAMTTYVILGDRLSFLRLSSTVAAHTNSGPNLPKFIWCLLVHGAGCPRQNPSNKPCEKWQEFHLCIVKTGLLMLVL